MCAVGGDQDDDVFFVVVHEIVHAPVNTAISETIKTTQMLCAFCSRTPGQFWTF